MAPACFGSSFVLEHYSSAPSSKLPIYLFHEKCGGRPLSRQRKAVGLRSWPIKGSEYGLVAFALIEGHLRMVSFRLKTEHITLRVLSVERYVCGKCPTTEPEQLSNPNYTSVSVPGGLQSICDPFGCLSPTSMYFCAIRGLACCRVYVLWWIRFLPRSPSYPPSNDRFTRCW